MNNTLDKYADALESDLIRGGGLSGTGVRLAVTRFKSNASMVGIEKSYLNELDGVGNLVDNQIAFAQAKSKIEEGLEEINKHTIDTYFKTRLASKKRRQDELIAKCGVVVNNEDITTRMQEKAKSSFKIPFALESNASHKKPTKLEFDYIRI